MATAYVWCINICNLIVGISLIGSFSIVYLNYTFTFDDLPDGSIPYYIDDNPADPEEKDSGRFGLYWFVYATDALRLLFPLLLSINVIILRYAGADFLGVIFTIFLLLLVIGEVIKFIWAIILWIPENCELHQFCRNFGARRNAIGVEVGEDPQVQNFVYQFMTWYNAAFAVAGITYVILMGQGSDSLESWKREKTVEQLKKDPPIQGWIVWTLVALSSILVVGLIIYFPLVFQNFTFTNSCVTSASIAPPISRFNLPDDNVPFYFHVDIGDATEGQSGQYQLYWWLYASDGLLILVSIAVLGTISLIVYSDKGSDYGFTTATQIFIFLLFVLQSIKFLWVAILGFSSQCEDHQFCRPFCARSTSAGVETGCNPRNLNFVYASLGWFQLIFSILLFLLLIVVSSMKQATFRIRLPNIDYSRRGGYIRLTGEESTARYTGSGNGKKGIVTKKK